MSYKTSEEWLNSPREKDRIEVHYGIYIDTDNKVKTFVSSEEKDIPKDILIVENDIITSMDAYVRACLMLNSLTDLSSQIESIKYKRRIRTYFYGVFKSSKGKVSTFICKSQNKIPANALVIKSGSMIGELASELADELLKGLQYKPQEKLIQTKQKKPKPQKLTQKTNYNVGDIIIYADLEGQHTAIILQSDEQYSTLLFVTSNPYWNKKARRVTEEENMLLGYPIRCGTSFFAPVVRINKYIVETGKSYPLYRIKDFIEEFKINGR